MGMKHSIKAILLSTLMLPVFAACSDDPKGDNTDPNLNLFIPTTPPERIEPTHVIIENEMVKLTPELLTELRNEADKTPSNAFHAEVTAGGQLERKVGSRPMYIDALSVTGPINAADFAFMKKCVAEGVLRSIDLSKAEIENNAIPDRAFFAKEYYLRYDDGACFLQPPYLPLYHLTLPEGLTSIGRMAFINLLLTELAIPSTVKTLAEDCMHRNIFLSGTLTIPAGVTTIPESCFEKTGDGNLEVVLGDGVKTIKNAAFYTAGISSITLNEGLEVLERGALCGASSLETITLPASLKRIEAYSMCHMKNLKSITTLSEDPQIALTVGDSFENFVGTPFGHIYEQNEGDTPHDIPLYIPAGCFESYTSTLNGWLWFMGNIIEMD